MSDKMKFTFNVKNDSAIQFFLERVSGFTEVDGNTNPYYLMRDSILIKNNCDIVPGRRVKFELFDKGNSSGRRLVNTYIYEVFDFDDVCIEMKLVDFNVKLDDTKK